MRRDNQIMDTPRLLGIEIGGTKLQLGLGRGDGRIEALERRTVNPGRCAPRGSARQLAAAIEPLLDRVDLELWPLGAIAAVGVGFGGPVDVERGIVSDVASDRRLGADFRWPTGSDRLLKVDRVAIQNDADTAGLAEARFGAGVGFSPVLYVTIGSGNRRRPDHRREDLSRGPAQGRWKSGHLLGRSIEVMPISAW